MTHDIERKLALLSLLAQAPRPLTRQQIKQKLDVFYQGKAEAVKKMFDRDKASLIEDGYSIGVTRVQTGEVNRQRSTVEGYFLDLPEPFDPDFVLTSEQAEALRYTVDEMRISGQLPGIALVALNKLLAFHTTFQTPVEELELNHNDRIISGLLLAITKRQTVRIEYPNAQEVVERRVLSPYGVFFSRGNLFVVGQCHRDAIPKVFSIHKIRWMATAEEYYLAEPKGFDLARYSQTNNWLADEKWGQRILIRVSSKEAWRVKEYHPLAVVREKADGSLLAQFWVSHPPRFFRFLLKFGTGAVIDAPYDFREDFQHFLRMGALAK